MIIFKLDKLLQEIGISRHKFAIYSGVRPNTINDMCKGITKRIEVDTLNSIIKALNELSNNPISIAELMEYRENYDEHEIKH